LHSGRPYPDRGDGYRVLEFIVFIFIVNYLANGEFIGRGVAINSGRPVQWHPDRDRQLGDVPAGQ